MKNIDFNPVVFGLTDASVSIDELKYLSQELIQSELFANKLNISLEKNLINSYNLDVFESGKNSGWKWGYQYYSSFNEANNTLLISGLGDKALYLEHSDFDILNPLYWFNLIRQKKPSQPLFEAKKSINA